MKENKRVLVLIILIIAFLAIGIIARINSIKNLDKTEDSIKCNTNSYHLITYSYIEEKNDISVFLTNEKDYDKEKRLNEKDKNNLNFEEHDYLVYFISPQGGCERQKRLNCIEYEEKGIKLNFDHFKVDETCDVIYHDAFIIELEKNKYDKDITIQEIVSEVTNEED